jgi:hypothetical protein
MTLSFNTLTYGYVLLGSSILEYYLATIIHLKSFVETSKIG